MAKILVCDECGGRFDILPTNLYDMPPDGWRNVNVTHEEGPNEYRILCSDACEYAWAGKRIATASSDANLATIMDFAAKQMAETIMADRVEREEA